MVGILKLPPSRQIFVYHGSSMLGTFQEDDVLVVVSISGLSVQPGDIVAFRNLESCGTSKIIVHRVLSVDCDMLITKADIASLPDSRPVYQEDLVGRVEQVQRSGKTYVVQSGKLGQLKAGYSRAILFMRTLYRLLAHPVRPIYRLLRVSGILSYFWRPTISKISLLTEYGVLVKYINKKKTVAHWWRDMNFFSCKKPYDLVLKPPHDRRSRLRENVETSSNEKG